MTRMRQSVDKSSTKGSTKVDFRAYYWNSKFDGSNTQGEGTLNWKGTVDTNGARRNGGGINLSGNGNMRGASGFSNAPNGGNGCKKNLGRWSGNLYWYVRSAAAQCFSSRLASPRERVRATTVFRLPMPIFPLRRKGVVRGYVVQTLAFASLP